MHHDDADDLDVENRLVVLVHFDLGDPLHDVNARLDAPEDCVFVVEPRRGDGGDEELRAVGARPSVRHRECVGTVVAQRSMELILELVPPDGRPSGAIPERVTGLDHEILDDAVEEHSVVVPVRRMRREVLDRLRALLGE